MNSLQSVSSLKSVSLDNRSGNASLPVRKSTPWGNILLIIGGLGLLASGIYGAVIKPLHLSNFNLHYDIAMGGTILSVISIFIGIVLKNEPNRESDELSPNEIESLCGDENGTPLNKGTDTQIPPTNGAMEVSCGSSKSDGRKIVLPVDSFKLIEDETSIADTIQDKPFAMAIARRKDEAMTREHFGTTKDTNVKQLKPNTKTIDLSTSNANETVSDGQFLHDPDARTAPGPVDLSNPLLLFSNEEATHIRLGSNNPN